MKKYMMLMLSIIGLSIITSGSVLADHYEPPAYCQPGLYVEMSGEYLFYDPLISVDCPLFFSAALSHFYELTGVEIAIEHQRFVGGSWQIGPRNYSNSFSNWDLADTNILTYDYWQIGGGWSIENYNTEEYDRYRLVVILNGASTHQPFFDGYTLRDDEYVSEWVYGIHAVDINPTFDDAPDGIADQDRGEDIPTRPSDRDHDGIPDATDQCPDVSGPAALHGCPVSVDDVTNGRQENLPSSGSVCTVETSMAMIFVFGVAPDAPIPVGTNPIAIIDGDTTGAGDTTMWSAEIINSSGIDHEYMVYPAWSSLVRVGGTCHAFGEITNLTTGQ